jgi:hypothetical protein
LSERDNVLLNEVFGLPFRQSEVDFVIPDLAEDLRVYVDPFLFYKSQNGSFQAVHATIREFFDTALAKVRGGEKDTARRMISFPEVKETMLGLSNGSHSGRGMGKMRDEIIYNEIVSNPDILKRGIRHLAEMQLLIEGIGFDMISDMCTNIAKPFFVSYTHEQAAIHRIPVESGVCLEHVFDWDELDWDDTIVDLPVNPVTGRPILLVPKAVVRRFSEIDYKDFWNTVYRYILREIEVQKSIQAIGREPKVTWKQINEKYHFCKKTVVTVLHQQPDLKQEYVRKVEARPEAICKPIDLNEIPGTDRTVLPLQQYIDELHAIRHGNEDCRKYEDLIVRMLNRLFAPSLSDPHSQVRTEDGREIIDITFYNSADHGFWHDIKSQHGSLIVVFELKNMADLSNEEYFQIAARLDDFRGRFGILIARGKDGLDIQRAYRRLRNERKVILTLSDDDFTAIVQNVSLGLSPTTYLNRLYRQLIEEA